MIRRQTVVIGLLLTGLALIFMSRALFPPVGQALAGHDARALFVPWFTFTREALGDGRLPLWDAAQFAGYPFLSNPQVALFYPPTWIALLPPVNVGLSWHVVFHIVVAGLGMYLFVRFMSGSWRGALLAALAFAFSGFWAARIWAGHVGLLATDAWLPWLLLATAWSARRRDVWSAIIAGVPLALAILAGHTASLLYIGLVWGIFALYLFLDGRDRRIWRQVIITGLMGLLLSAVQVIPMLQFTAVSARAEEATLAFATQFSFPPAHLITLLIPEFFGEPTRAGYWSVPSFDELTYYVGVLALVGLVLALRRPSHLTWFYVALIVLGLLLAFGSYGFLYEIFYRFLPPFRLARAPARAAFLFVFAASALLGEAVAIWERDGEGLSKLMRWVLGTAVVAGFAALAATAAVFAAQHPSDTSGRYWHQMGGWALALLLLVIGGVLLWRYLEIGDWRLAIGGLSAISNLQSPNLLFFALVACVLVDLWLFGWKLVQVGPTAVHPLWTDAKAIIGEAEGRVLPWGISIFEQNGAGQVGLMSVFGYNALEVGANTAFAGSIPDPRSSAYDVLGARYVLAQADLAQYTDGERPLTLIGQTAQVRVYERARVLPLARLVYAAEIIPDETAAIARVHQPDFDTTTTAILAEEPACALGGVGEGTAVITDQRDGYWRIETSSNAPALLVLSETAYPGWQVTVDGEKGGWQEAYTAVRAVCVPAGEHVVEWVFNGRVFLSGGFISALALLLVCIAFIKVRKNKPHI
ncbi:MAG: hypothetical protein KF770_11125 [Anaerolineae bacterium]|nr:hypothetical protein [Anaerolineae bacterium]